MNGDRLVRWRWVCWGRTCRSSSAWCRLKSCAAARTLGTHWPEFGLACLGTARAAAGLSARYQQPEAITRQWGYIPGGQLHRFLRAAFAAALLALLAGLCCKLPKAPPVVSRLAPDGGAGGGSLPERRLYRCAGVVRTHHAENLAAYQFFVRTIGSGLAGCRTIRRPDSLQRERLGQQRRGRVRLLQPVHRARPAPGPFGPRTPLPTATPTPTRPTAIRRLRSGVVRQTANAPTVT